MFRQNDFHFKYKLKTLSNAAFPPPPSNSPRSLIILAYAQTEFIYFRSLRTPCSPPPPPLCQ